MHESADNENTAERRYENSAARETGELHELTFPHFLRTPVGLPSQRSRDSAVESTCRPQRIHGGFAFVSAY